MKKVIRQHRDSLWLIMRSYDITSKIINMVKVLYNDFECTEVSGEDRSEWFKNKTGLKHGCNMSGLPFLLVVDWVNRHTLQEEKTGRKWKFTTKFEDLDFADDTPYYHRPSNKFRPKPISLPMKQKRLD